MRSLRYLFFFLCLACNKTQDTPKILEDVKGKIIAPTTNIYDSINSSVENNVNVQENFESFFQNFSIDSTFQISRVEFPYKVILDEENGTVTRYIPKDEWLYIDFSQMRNGQHHLEKKLESETVVKMVYTLEDTGVYITYIFNKKDGKWVLVSMEDSST